VCKKHGKLQVTKKRGNKSVEVKTRGEVEAGRNGWREGGTLKIEGRVLTADEPWAGKNKTPSTYRFERALSGRQ